VSDDTDPSALGTPPWGSPSIRPTPPALRDLENVPRIVEHDHDVRLVIDDRIINLCCATPAHVGKKKLKLANGRTLVWTEGAWRLG